MVMYVQVFALIRYTNDPQRFSIEYVNGIVRKYSATERCVSLHHGNLSSTVELDTNGTKVPVISWCPFSGVNCMQES